MILTYERSTIPLRRTGFCQSRLTSCQDHILEASKPIALEFDDEKAVITGENTAASESERKLPFVPPYESGPLTKWDAVRRVLSKPQMLWSILNAQLRLRGAKQLPLSVRLWGRARAHGGGKITFGERVRISGTLVPVDLAAWAGGWLKLGHGVFINYGTTISAHELVLIGNDCQLGQEVIINDNDYHDIIDKRKTPPSRPVILEDRVWLGARVIVLKGVRIGHDSVVAAGSLVVKDIPPCSLAIGSPARVVRTWE
jgi:acetyltransferase-like isoleucine patch superfamily enzyme